MDVVGPAEGVEQGLLDVVQVHHHVGDVPEEPQPATVGRDVDPLARVGAVEEQVVHSRLTLHHVVVVARVPGEPVVAGAEQGHVIAVPAGDLVVAVAAQQHVGPVAAEDVVVAGTTVDGERDQSRQPVSRLHDVVPAVGVEYEVLAGPDVDAERCRVDPVEPNPDTVGRDREALRTVGSVDLDGVGSRPALVEVGVVAGNPGHPVVAGLSEHLVVGVTTGEDVVLGPTEQLVEAAPAQQRVVAGLAEDEVAAGPAGDACRCRSRRTGWLAAAPRWPRSG